MSDVALRHAAAFVRPTMVELRKFVAECHGANHRTLVWLDIPEAPGVSHSRVRSISGRLVMDLDEAERHIVVMDTGGCQYVSVDAVVGAIVGDALDEEVDDIVASLVGVAATVLPQLLQVDDVWPGTDGGAKVYFVVQRQRPLVMFVRNASENGRQVEVTVFDPVRMSTVRYRRERLWAVESGMTVFEPEAGPVTVTGEIADAVVSMRTAEEAYLLLLAVHQRSATAADDVG